MEAFVFVGFYGLGFCVDRGDLLASMKFEAL